MRHLVTRAVAPRTSVWKARDRWTALAAGTAYVGLGLVSRGTPGQPEQRVFQAANHDTSNVPLLRIPQQLGTPWVLPALAVLGFATGRPHLAVTGALALPVEKSLEVAVKKTLERKRPHEADPDAELHDDAPTEGGSYPSGHAAIAFTAVLLTAPYLPAPVNGLGLLNAGLASWVRVRQGAHFPVDAVGGALLGVLVASTLRAVVGRPRVTS